MSTDKKELTTLDRLKKIEKRTQLKALSNVLSEIKRMARDVLILKEEGLIMLEELGLDKKEIKGIIDWINSLKDIQISEEDRKDIKERAKGKVKQEKKEAEQTIKENPYEFLANYVTPAAETENMAFYSTSGTSNTTLCNASDGSIQAKLE